MVYQSLTVEDIDKLSALQPEGWPDITRAFQIYCSHHFCHPYKITLNGTIAGIGNTIIFERTAWLAHIIVHKEFRNRGLGAEIVHNLLEENRKSGVETSLLIATDLGAPVYIKAGFRKVSEYRYFKKEPAALNLSANNTNIKPFQSNYYNDVLSLDFYISGENRELLMRELLDQSFVFMQNGSIEGFYIPGFGEGPVFAKTKDAGRALLQFKLAYSEVDKITVPSENRDAIEFLLDCGLSEINTAGTRMVFGKGISWKPDMVYCRMGGNFG